VSATAERCSDCGTALRELHRAGADWLCLTCFDKRGRTISASSNGKVRPLGKIRPFAWINGALACAHRPDVDPTMAHVLLVLAKYADGDGVAYPSIARIACDTGRKPKASNGGNGAVSSALRRLEQLGLITTIRRGNGQSAVRRLLPAVLGLSPSDVPPGGREVPETSRGLPRASATPPPLSARRDVPPEGRLHGGRQAA
jgi:hypothetical protein